MNAKIWLIVPFLFLASCFEGKKKVSVTLQDCIKACKSNATCSLDCADRVHPAALILHTKEEVIKLKIKMKKEEKDRKDKIEHLKKRRMECIQNRSSIGLPDPIDEMRDNPCLDQLLEKESMQKK